MTVAVDAAVDAGSALLCRYNYTHSHTHKHTHRHTEAARGAAETDNNAHLVAHAAQSDGSRAVRQSVSQSVT